MSRRPSRQATPFRLQPLGLALAGAVLGALLVVWSVVPIVLLAFAAGWLNGAYLGATRKPVARLFGRRPLNLP